MSARNRAGAEHHEQVREEAGALTARRRSGNGRAADDPGSDGDAVNSAEAASIAAAGASGAKAFDADHDAAAVAAVKGAGSISAKWHRVSLRALLLLGVVLSVAATFLAVVTIQDGFLYVSGCDANRVGYGMGSPVGVALMVVMMLVQGPMKQRWFRFCCRIA